MAESDNCQVCSHPIDSHLMLSKHPSNLVGIMLCPVVDCQCMLTFGIGPRTPTAEHRDLAVAEAMLSFDDEEIAALRERVQSGGFE